MKKLARLFAAILAISMLLVPVANAYYFSDASTLGTSAAVQDAITFVYHAGIMQGDEEHRFNPSSYLRRCEMFKIMYVLNETAAQTISPIYASLISANDYPDWNLTQSWAKPYAAFNLIKEIFQGDENKMLNPENNMTYAQCAIVLLRWLGALTGPYTGNNFHKVTTVTASGAVLTTDKYSGESWSNNALMDALNYGLLPGMTSMNDFKSGMITRQDIAVMVYNAYKSAHKMFTGTEATSPSDLFANSKLFNGSTVNMGGGVITGFGTEDNVNYLYLNDTTSEKYRYDDLTTAASLLGSSIVYSTMGTTTIAPMNIESGSTFYAKIKDSGYLANSSDASKVDLVFGNIRKIKATEADINKAYTAVYYAENTSSELREFDGTLLEFLDYMKANWSADETVRVVVSGTAVSVFYQPTKVVKVIKDTVGNTNHLYVTGEGTVASPYVYNLSVNGTTYTVTKGEYDRISNDDYIAYAVDGSSASLISVLSKIFVDGNKLTCTRSGSSGSYTYQFRYNNSVFTINTNALAFGANAGLTEEYLYENFSGLAPAKEGDDTHFIIIHNGYIIDAAVVKAGVVQPTVTEDSILYVTDVASMKMSGVTFYSISGYKDGVPVNMMLLPDIKDVTGSYTVNGETFQVPTSGMFYKIKNVTHESTSYQGLVNASAEAQGFVTMYLPSGDFAKSIYLQAIGGSTSDVYTVTANTRVSCIGNKNITNGKTGAELVTCESFALSDVLVLQQGVATTTSCKGIAVQAVMANIFYTTSGSARNIDWIIISLVPAP